MKRTLIASLVALALAAPAFAGDATGPRDGVFIHISRGADDPHRLLMALKMATVMAEGKKDVLVYCDIEAVKVLGVKAPDVTHPAFPSAREQLRTLRGAGVLVRACPSCLKAAGMDPKELMEGVALADREEFFTFTKGRILTLDY